MKMIDRYVYTVIKRLPEREQQDVETSLRESIDDMLPDNYSEADVEKTLLALGNPAVLAEKYREDVRYLISPTLYNSYISVLKIVLTVIVCIAPLITILSMITSEAAGNERNLFITFLLQTMIFILEAGFQAFTWITILFAINDRINNAWFRWPYTGKAWTLSDLEDSIPSKKNQIEISDPIVAIIFTLIFIIVFGFFPGLIGAYIKAESGWRIIPMFHPDTYRQFLPLLLASAGLNLIVAILKLIYQRWNQMLAIINSIENILSLGVLGAILLTPSFFNHEFLVLIAGILEIDLTTFMRGWQWGTWGIVGAPAFLGSIWDSITGFRKAAR